MLFFKGIIGSSFIIVIDQLTKWYMFYRLLADGESLTVTSFLNLVRVYNSGISFGMFAGSSHNPLIFTALSGIIVVLLLWWMYKATHPLLAAAYALIIGGAIGNVIDRITSGAVMDFLDFHVAGYHWPAFNIADAAICIGAVLLFSDVFRKPAPINTEKLV